MALFKINKGKKANLPSTYTEGYCYFTTDDGKFYIDTTDAAAGRILLNAGKADQLAIARTFQIADNDATNKGPAVSFNGSANVIINLPSTIKASIIGNAGSASQLGAYSIAGEYTKNTLAYFNASVNHSGTAQVGVNDGPTTTNTWWHFLRFTHSNSNGYYTDLAIPFNDNSIYYKRISNGSVQNSTTNAGWVKVLDALNYSTTLDSTYATITALQNQGILKEMGRQTDDWGGTIGIYNNRFTVFTNWWDSNTTYMPYLYGSGLMIPHLDSNYRSFIYFQCNTAKAWIGACQINVTDTPTWKQIWCNGDSVTGAVWNDYAEYRESDCTEYGRVLVENGDDTLSMSTERLQPFAGISSDTWGFCQGETEKAKTPIAVAGRVLVYPYRNRNEYKPGDVVCAAPNGTVDIMTPQEEMMYPSRIVGTVSCVPNYEEWGNGDREPAKVNGRIWIKVR